MNECCLCDNTLTQSVQEGIEKLIDDELVFIIAVSKGKRTFIAGNGLPFSVTPLSAIDLDNPIETTGIVGLNPAGFITYKGSCRYCYFDHGKLVCVDC